MDAQTSIFNFSDYRSFLKALLDERKAKNSQYSLRAFARDLQMQASALSEILSGKKNLSLEKALGVGKILNLSVREITFLCYIVAIESCLDLVQKAKLQQELTGFVENHNRLNLDMDTFQIIARWECVAILELLTVYQDKPADFLAQSLDLSIETIQSALEQLSQVKLIRANEKGFERTTKAFVISSAHNNLALKMYHSAMLEKARGALYTQSPKERYTGTETLMIDPLLLPEAHQLMNECLDKLVGLFHQSQKKTSLVHIQFNLFELNKKSKKDAS